MHGYLQVVLLPSQIKYIRKKKAKCLKKSQLNPKLLIVDIKSFLKKK